MDLISCYKYAGFIQECGQLFDIKYKTDERKKLQEKAWKVDMTKKDQTFYKNMKKVQQQGYCSTFADRTGQKITKKYIKQHTNII